MSVLRANSQAYSFHQHALRGATLACGAGLTSLAGRE